MHCGWRFWSFISPGGVSLWASEELLTGIFQPTVAVWGLVGRDTPQSFRGPVQDSWFQGVQSIQ